MKNFLPIILFFIAFQLKSQTTITWTGNQDSLWNNSLNWSPTQIPNTSNHVVIPNTSIAPQVNVSATILNLTVNSGATLKLNSLLKVRGNLSLNSCNVLGNNTLRADSVASDSLSARNINITNATVSVVISLSGSTINLNGNTFNSKVDARRYNLNNATFGSSSNGGNAFNQKFSFINKARSQTRFGVTNPDVFNDTVDIKNFNNIFIMAHSSQGNEFKKQVKFFLSIQQDPYGAIYIGDQINSNAKFYDNIIYTSLHNNIVFLPVLRLGSNTSGWIELAENKTIVTGNTPMIELQLTKFKKLGSDSFIINNNQLSVLVANRSVFEGPVNWTLNSIRLNGGYFNKNVTIFSNSNRSFPNNISEGNNYFKENFEINRSTNHVYNLANTNPDTCLGNYAVRSTTQQFGSYNVFVNSSGNIIHGDLIAQGVGCNFAINQIASVKILGNFIATNQNFNTSFNGITFGNSNGLTELEGNITINNGNPSSSFISFKNFRKKSANSVTFTNHNGQSWSPIRIENCPEWRGDLNIFGLGAVLNNSTFYGKVKIDLNRLLPQTNGSISSSGGNVFHSKVTLINNVTGSTPIILTGNIPVMHWTWASTLTDTYLDTLFIEKSNSSNLNFVTNGQAILKSSLVVNDLSTNKIKFAEGTGKITFNGDKNQTITSTNQKSIQIKNLEINKESNFVTAADSIVVTGNLALTNGVLKTPNVNKPIEIRQSSTITGGNDFSYIDGYVLNRQNSIKYFPVGHNNRFMPIYSDSASASLQLKVRYRNENSHLVNSHTNRGSFTDSISTKEYWEVLQNNNPLSNLKLKLSLDTLSLCALENATDIQAAQTQPTNWNKLTQNGVIPFTDSKVLLKFTLANQASSLITFAKDSVWCDDGQDDYDWDIQTHEFPILPNFNRLFDFRYISGSSIITNDTLQVNGNTSAKSSVSGLLTSNGTIYSNNHPVSIQNISILNGIIDTIRNIHGLKINEGTYQVSLNRGVYYLRDFNLALKNIKLVGDSSDYFLFMIEKDFKFNEEFKIEYSNIDPKKIIFYSFNPIIINKVVLPGFIISSSTIEYNNTYISSNAYSLKSITFNDVKGSQIPIAYRFVRRCDPNPCNTGLYNGNFQEISVSYDPTFPETIKDPFSYGFVCGWEAFRLHPNLSINPSLPQVNLNPNNAVTNTTNNYAVMWAGLNNEHESLISTSRFQIQASVQYTFTCSLRYNSNQQFSNLITQINGNPPQEMFRFLFVLTDFDSNFSPNFTDLGAPGILQYPDVPTGNNFIQLIPSPTSIITNFTNTGWQTVSITFTPTVSIPNARLYISPRINAGAGINNFTLINQQQSGSFPAIYAEIDDISISGLTTDNLIYTTNVTNLWQNISFVNTNFLSNTTPGPASNTINNNWSGNNFDPTSNHIIVNGAINVNSGEVLNITNSHLAFPTTSSIVVNGGTLNISNSWLHGCDFLWRGITVLNGGHVNIVNSYIEDALVGLSSLSILNPNQQGTYSISNSFFNKNRIHISVTNANNPGTISSTTFSSSDLTLKANINETHDSRTQIGIRLRNVRNFQLSPAVGQENTFTESYFGIYSTNSTFNINNNMFRNIDCSNYKGPGFNCSNTYATVYSSSNLNQFAGGSAAIAVLNLPNYSTNTVSNVSNSRFSNLQFGVVMDNPLSINLHKNIFNRISYINFSDFQAQPYNRPGNAILSRNMGSNRTLNITENRFNNAENSINIGANRSCTILIDQNACNYNALITQPTLYTGQTRAISVTDDDITPINLTISDNSISMYDHGIVAQNLGDNPSTMLISNNQIILNLNSTSSLDKIGINVINSSGKLKNVINNNVGANSTLPSRRFIGYHFNNSGLNSILCNTAVDTYTGFSFFGVCETFFGRNTINNANRAINLRSALIGLQGSTQIVNLKPRLNSWQGNINNHFFAEELTNGAASHFVLNTWNSPMFSISNLVSSFLDVSSPVTTSSIFQQNNFETPINNGCGITGGWLDIGENASAIIDIIRHNNDTLYSNTFKNDLAFQFLNQYESDTAWQNIAEAALLFDSLSNSLIGKLYNVQKSLNHWPNIDNVLINMTVSGLFTNYRNEVLVKINQLDSLQSQDAYFVNLIDVFKLQTSKLVFDTDKVLFYESLNLLSIDSLLQIFESDSLLNFELDSATLNKMETLATNSAKENGISVYQARSILDTEFLIDEFYLNPLELPSNQTILRLSNIDEDEDKNLVENGSFEEMYECPTGIGQIYKAKYWSSPNRGYGYESIDDTLNYYYKSSTPDLLALCNNYNNSMDTILFNDIQLGPFEGDNFARIILGRRDLVNNSPFFISDSCFSREYIQGTLKSQLIQGKKYIFSMRLLLNKTYGCDSITNKLSIYFSSDSLSEFSDLCGYTPQIVTNTYFDKNDEWKFYQSEYIANGSENYFSIGLFLPNDKLELIDNPLCEWPHSFVDNSLMYLFDDVRMECADENGCGLVSNGEEIRSQKLTIFPNPASQQVYLTFSEPFNKELSYTITDLQGRQLLQGSIQNQETVLDVSILSKGIYLLNISDANGNKWNKKIVKGE